MYPGSDLSSKPGKSQLTAIHRTRIAPTPSGYLHLGNVLSFALTATLALQQQASILLRIDDLDRQRMRPEYVQDIFDTLDYLGIPWQEGPRDPRQFEQEYSQLHRMELYRNMLDQLRAEGQLFACSCSRASLALSGGEGYGGTCLDKHLPLDMPGTCWRLRTPADARLQVKTGSGMLDAALPPEQRYFIVRKKDGFPSYQLASLADDHYFGIDLVVRGADLWPSTLVQLCLARATGLDSFSRSTFYHHALLSGPSGEKLSKSAGDTSLRHLRREGRKPSEIYTLIAARAGIPVPVTGWQELGALLLERLEEAGPPAGTIGSHSKGMFH